MQFLWPQFLWVLFLLPPLFILYLCVQWRRRRLAMRYSGLLRAKQAVQARAGLRRHIPSSLFLVAIALLILAAARPAGVIEGFTPQGTVVLAIDTSASMQANDLKPNRLAAAQEAARALVEQEPVDVRIGVVSFSDVAAIGQAPTTNRNAIRAAIDRLSPQSATAVGGALLTALDAISEQGQAATAPTPLPSVPRSTGAPVRMPAGQPAPAIIVLLTDGENNVSPSPLEVVNQLVNQGVPVYTVGVGSPEGTILHIQGRAVRTRLDEATLKRIANDTGGSYYNAENEKDLYAIYENLARRPILHADKTEFTAGLVGAAAVVLLISQLLSLWWFGGLP